MSEVTLARARIVPGKADRLREWYAELERREDEVVETLQHEGVSTETAFLDASGEPGFLYVYMEATDLEAADEAGNDEAFEVDEQHHEVLGECLDSEWEALETIGHYVNPARSA